MADLDDNIEDMDPSAVSALDDTAEVSAVEAPEGAEQAKTEGEAAAPSPATGEKPDDLLSVVRDVVSERKTKGAASPAEGEGTGDKPGEKSPKEPDDENYSDVPFHKHPRFQQLLRKSKAYEQDAQRFGEITTFLSNAGLSNEEAADGLIIMGLMKSNPVEAWQKLKPTIQKLLVAAGEVLPDDLRQMVQEGKLDEAGALEISRSRAGVNSMQVQRSFEQQQRERAQQREAANTLSGAANSWEEDRRRKDPNFEAKFAPLQKEILWLQQTEGRPNTAEGVRAQLEKAYKAVNASLKPPAPRPQPRPATQHVAPRKPEIKPVTGGQVAGNNRSKPESTLDIVRANRRSAN